MLGSLNDPSVFYSIDLLTTEIETLNNLDFFLIDQLDGDRESSFNCSDFVDTTNVSLIVAISLF